MRDSNEPFPFWSGTISFGLVSVPVDLYSSVRTNRVPMRMLSPRGTPLKRRYYCSADNKQLAQKDIVRGYEQDDGTFVAITDDELEKLAPRKSRDIDLRLFVERAQIPVRLLQRPYILAPGGESTKAYHLLAQTMERLDLAGIATFVMRGKEYLAAIVAEGGLLKATTLHFSDEIRTPEAIGLPDVEKAPDTVRKRAQKALKAFSAKDLDLDLFVDTASAELLDLAEAKHESQRDVVEVGTAIDTEERDEEGGDIVDIMTLLRKRMEGSAGPETAMASTPGKRSAEPSRRSSSVGPARNGRSTGKPSAPGKGDAPVDDLASASRQALYARASELEISGRSAMTKEELIAAIRKSR